jgi:hypothetical protein
MSETELTAYELWMVKSNLQYVDRDGIELVVARLKANGYHRVADGVRGAFLDTREAAGFVDEANATGGKAL